MQSKYKFAKFADKKRKFKDKFDKFSTQNLNLNQI